MTATQVPLQKLSTVPFSDAKKSGTKRENPPFTPLKRKARGKENNPGALGTCLFACERPRTCAALRKRHVEAAVEDALRIFCGTRKQKTGKTRDGRDARRPSFSDEQLWAKFAWKFGWGLLRELTLQGEAEMREHKTPIPDKDKPKILQELITPFWKRGAK